MEEANAFRCAYLQVRQPDFVLVRDGLDPSLDDGLGIWRDDWLISWCFGFDEDVFK